MGIGLPSLRNSRNSDLRPRCRFNPENPMPYHYQPWEVHADMIAGIYRPRYYENGELRERRHSIEGIALGLLYLEYLNSNSFLTIAGNMWDFSEHNFSAIKEGHL